MRPAEIAGFLLYAAAAAVGRLPLAALERIGDGVAWLARRLNIREARVAGTNLRIIRPQASAGDRDRLLREVLRGTFRGLLLTLRFWTRAQADNLRLVGAVHGQELFDAALASGKGLIIAAPHYGHWELLNQWLAARTPITVLYRPPEHAAGEAFLRRVRGRANVRQVAAGSAAMRQLFKTLAAGGTVGILPDQLPKAGDGVYAPFYGWDVLTMTLLPRLAQRTGATVLFAIAERDRLAHPARFTIHLFQAPSALHDPDTQTAAAAMNAAVQAIAERDPAAYQWTYKRFSKRPPGEPNPYGLESDR